MKIVKVFFIAAILLVAITSLKAQQNEVKNKFRGFAINGHSGSHIYTGDLLNESLDNGYGAISIKLSWVPGTDSTSWQQHYGYPSYGLGVYSGAIGNPDILGTPNAIFGFVSFPVYQTRKTSFVVEPAVGLTYDLKPHDSEENPMNDAIGSKICVYFNLNFGGRTAISREMDLTYGFDLSHFSNGRTFVPNYGLNMAGLNVGMLYHFNRAQKIVDNSLKPKTILEVRPDLPASSGDVRKKQWYFSAYQAAGTTQKYGFEDVRYFNASTSIEAVYKRSMKHSWLLGFDLLYDGSLKNEYPETSGQFAYAIHPGYDFSFYKFDLRAQVGIYLGDNKDKGPFFLRPALRYWFTNAVFAQVGLKTINGFAADWVEYGVGVKLWSSGSR
jgi:hypothetical protein